MDTDQELYARLVEQAAISQTDRKESSKRAADWISLLPQYGLSTEEGVALMCLAEALLRVPDADTIDALIEDKIAPRDWTRHLGQSSSSLVNVSTLALMFTGNILLQKCRQSRHGNHGKAVCSGREYRIQ